MPALAALENLQIVITPIEWFDLDETHWGVTFPAGTVRQPRILIDV
jgi:hypothetical protein